MDEVSQIVRERQLVEFRRLRDHAREPEHGGAGVGDLCELVLGVPASTEPTTVSLEGIFTNGAGGGGASVRATRAICLARACMGPRNRHARGRVARLHELWPDAVVARLAVSLAREHLGDGIVRESLRELPAAGHERER